MELGYNKVTEISTKELPFIDSSVPLTFGFVTSPSYQAIQNIRDWGQGVKAGRAPDAKDTARLACDVLVYVETPDNNRYVLEDEAAIEALIDETSLDFLVNLLLGWLSIKAATLAASKKKSTTPLPHLNGSAER